MVKKALEASSFGVSQKSMTVRVDAEKKRAYVEPGATLADFDEAAQSHGLATPVGINSTTGIAGLTLGGGFGWLTRKYGMTVDNLVSADVVTADGKRSEPAKTKTPTCFGQFEAAAVTLRLSPNSNSNSMGWVLKSWAGLIVFPFDQAKQVLTQYREFVAENPGWFRGLTQQEKDAVSRRLWAEGRLKVEPWLKGRILKEGVPRKRPACD